MGWWVGGGGECGGVVGGVLMRLLAITKLIPLPCLPPPLRQFWSPGMESNHGIGPTCLMLGGDGWKTREGDNGDKGIANRLTLQHLRTVWQGTQWVRPVRFRWAELPGSTFSAYTVPRGLRLVVFD